MCNIQNMINVSREVTLCGTTTPGFSRHLGGHFWGMQMSNHYVTHLTSMLLYVSCILIKRRKGMR